MARALRLGNYGYRYKLKAAIHAAGFRSQVEFAQAVGMDHTEISKIINGMSPTRPGLRKIAEGLSMTVFEVKGLL